MGLSICYRYQAGPGPAEARRVVQTLRERALSLPFDRVDEIHELDAPDGQGAPPPAEDRLLWARISAMQMIDHECGGERFWLPVRPLHVIGFSVRCHGAEVAPIGLATHEASVQHDCAGTPTQIATHLNAVYCWMGFCKTQYAGLPQRGGTENFVRAHRALIDLLDAAGELGLDLEVKDDAGFWTHRDEQKLIEQLDNWNREVAAIVGGFKDWIGDIGECMQAPICSHPAFEHLEAEGARKPNPPPEEDRAGR